MRIYRTTIVLASLSLIALVGCASLEDSSVGPEGGTIETDDGFKLVIPAGALSSATDITIERQNESPATAESPVYSLGPEGLTFAAPVTLHIPLHPTDLPDDMDRLLVAHTAPAESTDFQTLAVTAHARDWAEVETTHFSQFYISIVEPQVLAAAEKYPSRVACDGSHVYWTSGGNGENRLDHGNKGLVFRTALAGGSVDVLSSEQQDPQGVAVDGTHVYWVTGGRGFDDPLGPVESTVMRATKSGEAEERLSGASYPAALRVDATSVYWSDVDLGQILSQPLAGGEPTVLASAQGYDIEYLALDDTHVYWTTGDSPSGATGTVARVAKVGGEVEVLASGQGDPAGIVVDGGVAYFANSADGRVQYLPVEGGTPQLLYGFSAPTAIAIDAGTLYVADVESGRVYSVSTAGGQATIISGHQDVPWHMDFQGGYLVWSSAGKYDYTGTVVALDGQVLAAAR